MKDEIPICNAFPVHHNGRELATGDHSDPSGKYHEIMLQQAIAWDMDYELLMRILVDNGEFSRCHKDTYLLLLDAVKGRIKMNRRRSGPKPVHPAFILRNQLEILSACREVLMSGEAAREAARELTREGKPGKDVYSAMIRLVSDGYDFSVSDIKTALAAFGVGIKELSFQPPVGNS